MRAAAGYPSAEPQSRWPVCCHKSLRVIEVVKTEPWATSWQTLSPTAQVNGRVSILGRIEVL